MKCKCGKNMVLEHPNWINASNPASQWWICKCGNKELEQLGDPIIAPRPWQERWEDENKEDSNE